VSVMNSVAIEKLRQLRANLLQDELRTLSKWHRSMAKPLRIAIAVGRDLADGQLTMRAMSLVYTTLLSIVPLLAVSFSVLKAFGVHNQIEPALQNMLEPLGEKGTEITATVIGFVENVQVGVLGVVGVALLFYSVIALMQKVEHSFNYTWRVSTARTMSQRFSDYLSVLLVGPILVLGALGIMGTLLNSEVTQWIAGIEPLGSLLRVFTKSIPYLMIIGAFTFIYVFMPNTRVRLKPALIGGIVTGILWQTLGWGFAAFVVSSSKYAAIYSAFATLILFLMWLYLGWLVLLTGASIAFYVQNPGYVNAPRGTIRLSSEFKEKLALLLLYDIGWHFYHHKPARTINDLVAATQTSENIISQLLSGMKQQGLLSETDDSPQAWLPARPLDELTLTMTLQAVRRDGDDQAIREARHLRENTQVTKVIKKLENGVASALGQMTIKDLVKAEERDGKISNDIS